MEFRKTADEPIRWAGIKTRAWIKDVWTQWGKDRAGQIEKVALTYILYHAQNR